MYKTVKNTIERLVKKGVPRDWLEDLAEIYSINDDGQRATARYIINGIESETETYLETIGNI